MADGTQEEQQPKRRRRQSGWDIPGPIAPLSQTAPVITAALGIPVQPNDILVAQQQALQRAQLVLAQQALTNPLLAQKPTGRIYVGSIHYELKESDIVALFSSFGTVVKSEMTIDPATGRTKGFCFLEFADPAAAESAMAMDGFELAGRKIKVGRPFHGQGAVQANNNANPLGASLTGASLGFPASNPLKSVPSSSSSIDIAALVNATVLSCILIKKVAPTVSIKEVRTIFEAFGKIKRCQFVEPDKLDAVTDSTKAVAIEYDSVAVAHTTAAGMNMFALGGLNLSVEVISLSRGNQLLELDPSKCRRVVLEDMVTYEDAQDPDLKDEVGEEALNYGTLEKVEIDTDETTKQVTVTLLYAHPGDAAKCLKAMNGRAFGGKKIKAVLAP